MDRTGSEINLELMEFLMRDDRRLLSQASPCSYAKARIRVETPLRAEGSTFVAYRIFCPEN